MIHGLYKTRHGQVSNYKYSKVPNNSAARLLIFMKFSLPTCLIWTYTLIKIQTIFLPTRLLSTKFYFFVYFQCFWQPFFHYNCYSNAFFHAFSSLYYFLGWKKFWNCFYKRPKHLDFEKFLLTRLLGPTPLLNFKISSHLHCYLDSTLIQHPRVSR